MSEIYYKTIDNTIIPCNMFSILFDVIPAEAGIQSFSLYTGFPLKDCGNDRLNMSLFMQRLGYLPL